MPTVMKGSITEAEKYFMNNIIENKNSESGELLKQKKIKYEIVEQNVLEKNIITNINEKISKFDKSIVNYLLARSYRQCL